MSRSSSSGPKNLDLDGIEGLGDAIGDIGRGLLRQRAANALADLGIEATRIEQDLTCVNQQPELKSEGRGFVSPPGPDTNARNAAAIRQAEIAIRHGANPRRVLQRLRGLGINLDNVR